jgi:hypothetical protein
MVIATNVTKRVMVQSHKLNISDELNIQKKNLELLNILESRCEGLENLLCKNVINIISKKIDTIEKKFEDENNIRKEFLPGIKKEKVKKDKVTGNSAQNNNINSIEDSFTGTVAFPNPDTADIINKKIEENYRLLDELERTNRPIFSKTTDLNKMYIEDKLKEMDDRLSDLFSVNNLKNVEAYKKKDINEFSRDISFHHNTDNYQESPSHTAPSQGFSMTYETGDNELKKKKEELYSKLNDTEKRIKNIAGRILKNF